MIEKVTEWKKYTGHSPALLLENSADHVLRNFNNVISVYIEAPRHACVDRICKMLNVTPKRAEELIKKTDKYRYEYYKCYAGDDWRNPINYDFTLNSDRIGWERCVKGVTPVCQNSHRIWHVTFLYNF